MSFLKILILLSFTNLLFAYPNYTEAVKEKKLYPMGKKIYQQKCPKMNLAQYKNFDTLENDVINNGICTKLNHRYSDALLLYLWDVKREKNSIKHYEKLTVTKKDKCPVCGMFLYKYPRWVSRIEYTDKNVSFDGIKDMMKYYFEHKQNIKEILVQDYYTQQTIDANKAYFVLGSDVYGPMGNELIAFDAKDAAKRFALDHRGKKILTFKEITKDEVYKLDE